MAAKPTINMRDLWAIPGNPLTCPPSWSARERPRRVVSVRRVVEGSALAPKGPAFVGRELRRGLVVPVTLVLRALHPFDRRRGLEAVAPARSCPDSVALQDLGVNSVAARLDPGRQTLPLLEDLSLARAPLLDPCRLRAAFRC